MPAHFRCFVLAWGLAWLLPLSSQGADTVEVIVTVGSGSYTTVRPKSCKALPATIYETEALDGATPTNQWWSSLVWEPHSQNLFPHPLGMVCHQGGLSIGYPGAAIVAASGNIMGGGISKNGDIVIGHSEATDFPDAKLSNHSDWFITAEYSKGDAQLSTSFGHGIPFVFCRLTGGKPTLHFAEKPLLWSGDERSAVLGISVRGNHYGLFGASGSRWSMDGSDFVNETKSDYCSIALLPDNDPKTLTVFQKYAHNHVINTRVIPSVKGGFVHAKYAFKTKAMEAGGSGTIFALYPHQWKYTDTRLTEKTYRSVRGTMKVAVGSEFTTRTPVQGVLPMLPSEGIPDRERMVAYLKEAASKSAPDFGDTYWEGKHLGKLASMSGIAEILGEDKLRVTFNNEIKRRLENWFTASTDKDSPLFFYDSNWRTLIGSRPSYGSDSELNDHHFHYGYFIRAAAEVVRHDPAWAEKWGPMVNLLVREIASTDRKDTMFPYLRCFDIYAGHSWASGHAKFGDGNNQESSSESMNAWYALMLWGEATGDDHLRDTGAFLYNTERTAVEEYWFDVSGTNFPSDFPNVALGMVWGGKGAFATWFSGEIDHIHGINWLPFTPASIHLGRHPDYVKKNHDRVVERRKAGDDYNQGWGDLLVMYNALSNPKSAAGYFDANPKCNVESGNSRAFMYHWIHTLEQLGINDTAVTADHPFVNVYNKDGKKTYAAYNFAAEPKKVSFSDGTTLNAKAKSLTTLAPQP